jgi:N-acetylmuramoyl-L-alanine amidase CwlA
VQRSLSAIPYVDAANWSRHVAPQPKKWIVIHCMEAPEKGDTAEWCAGFFRDQPMNDTVGTSAHACVDNNSIVQCVPWDRIAWHAPGANKLGIGIEHAGYARQTASDWSDVYSTQMLDLSAWLVAELCAKFRIPVDFITADGLRAGDPGITTHVECTKAWPGKSTHWDPGPGFPIGNYLRSVSTYSVGAGTV